MINGKMAEKQLYGLSQHGGRSVSWVMAMERPCFTEQFGVEGSQNPRISEVWLILNLMILVERKR